MNYPFRSKLISRMYIIGISYSYVSMTMIILWVKTDSFNDTDVFYMIGFFSMMLAFILYAA